MREVAIVAAGMTRFGELWGASLRDLFVEAAQEALTAAGADHLDAIYVGNMSAGQFVGQEHLGPLMADHLGMAGVPVRSSGIGLRLGRRGAAHRLPGGGMRGERPGARRGRGEDDRRRRRDGDPGQRVGPGDRSLSRRDLPRRCTP